jgi:hypothetical protein
LRGSMKVALEEVLKRRNGDCCKGDEQCLSLIHRILDGVESCHRVRKTKMQLDEAARGLG